MKFRLLRGFVFAALLAAPALAYAFSVSPADKSMQYLGMIFGGVPGLPIQATGSTIFGDMVYIFNQIIFALGILIVVFTTVVGTVQTAQEGEVMGKKWSSVMVPLRAGVGVYLLLPVVGGLNWIQITVMWFIVQGVGAANALWEQAIWDNQEEGGAIADTRKMSLERAETTINMLFQSMMCVEAVNNAIATDAFAAQQLGNDFASAFRHGDQIWFGMGRDNAHPPMPICGSIKLPPIGSTVGNVMARATGGTGTTFTLSPEALEARKDAVAAGVIGATNQMIPAVEEALAYPDSDIPGGGTIQSTWTQYNQLVTAADRIKGAVSGIDNSFNQLSDFRQQAVTDGWIHAGSYYFNMIGKGVFNTQKVTLLGGETPDYSRLDSAFGNYYNADFKKFVTERTSLYLSSAKSTIGVSTLNERSGGQLVPVDVNPPGKASGVFDSFFGTTFSDMAADLGEQITTGCMGSSEDANQQNRDPILCTARFGADLASGIELTFWTALIALFFLWLGTSWMSCIQPLAHTMDFLVMIIVPIVTLMITLMWGAGITMALYVPMIPFLVFTFAALGWIILVVESMLGASLIALTLIVPSEDDIGKAGHAIVILLGLFLRPALMILGFIFAMKLIIVAVGMLNFGFSSTLHMSTGRGLGLFGFISVLMLYSGLVVGVVHESFSLIYALPDKVLRWMGAGGESSEAGQHAKSMGGEVDKGVGMGKGAMNTGLSTMKNKVGKIAK